MTPLQDITLKDVGLEAVFECIVTKAGLKPEWFHGTKAVKRTDDVEMKATENTYSLVISSAQGTHVGDYSIKFAPGVESTAKLTINGESILLVMLSF